MESKHRPYNKQESKSTQKLDNEVPIANDVYINNPLTPRTIIRLQQTIGNQAVMRLIQQDISSSSIAPTTQFSHIQREGDDNIPNNKALTSTKSKSVGEGILQKIANSKHRAKIELMARIFQSISSAYDGDGETNLKLHGDTANPPATSKDGPAKDKNRTLNSDPPGGDGPDPDADKKPKKTPKFTVNINNGKKPSMDDIWSHTVDGQKPKKTSKPSTPINHPPPQNDDDNKKRKKRRKRDGKNHRHVPKTQQIKKRVQEQKAMEKLKKSVGKKAFSKIPYIASIASLGATAYEELYVKPNQTEPESIPADAKPSVQQTDTSDAAVEKYIALEQKQATQYERKTYKELNPDAGWGQVVVDFVMDNIGGELSTADLYLTTRNLAKSRAARMIHNLEADGHTLSKTQKANIQQQVMSMYIAAYKAATKK